jgi:phage terminase small subunit
VNDLARKSDRLSDKQRSFIDEYVVDLNASKAAVRAGYSPRTARSQGQRLLTNVDILAEIHKRLQARRDTNEDRVEATIMELACLGFSRITEVCSWDEEGRVSIKPSDEIPEEVAAAIQSITQTSRTVHHRKDDTDETTTRLEIKLHSKEPALSDLAKILGLYRADNQLNTPQVVLYIGGRPVTVENV